MNVQPIGLCKSLYYTHSKNPTELHQSRTSNTHSPNLSQIKTKHTFTNIVVDPKVLLKKKKKKGCLMRAIGNIYVAYKLLFVIWHCMFALFRKHHFKKVFEGIHYDVSNIYNMYKIVFCHIVLYVYITLKDYLCFINCYGFWQKYMFHHFCEFTKFGIQLLI